MTIFAGDSLPVSGITAAGRQLSVGFCATLVIANNTTVATHSRDAPFDHVYVRFAMLFPRMRSLKSKSDL